MNKPIRYSKSIRLTQYVDTCLSYPWQSLVKIQISNCLDVEESGLDERYIIETRNALKDY